MELGIAYGGGKNNNELVVINADGSGRRVLTRAAAAVETVAWSPGGRRIAYLAPGFKKGALYVINPDGKARRRLSAAYGDLYWSPDGRQIAFTMQIGEEPDTLGALTEVFVIRADGTGLRQLDQHKRRNKCSSLGPGWAQLLVAIHTQLYLINANRAGLRNLTQGQSFPPAADWSPDGTQIAYETDQGIRIVRKRRTGAAAAYEGRRRTAAVAAVKAQIDVPSRPIQVIGPGRCVFAETVWGPANGVKRLVPRRRLAEVSVRLCG